MRAAAPWSMAHNEVSIEAPRTQFVTGDGEVSREYGPLLYLLCAGGRASVGPVDALLYAPQHGLILGVQHL